ncbi:hypothetical protein T484DRAFT_1790775 [Baffinella frigidus]|nr:hypothetical protein T484DRAFT_1790775 [Cryptophyta sp. CCMP2293]
MEARDRLAAGNRWFEGGVFVKALDCYTRALLLIKWEMGDGSEEEELVQEEKARAYLNQANP